jgi:hypothetical protein
MRGLTSMNWQMNFFIEWPKDSKLRARLVVSLCCLRLEQIYDLHDPIVDLVTPHSIFSQARQGYCPGRKHVKFLSQTAILEFKCGMPEQGRSRFELILRDYPKRTDLWSVYLDQVILHLQNCHLCYININIMFFFIFTEE